MRLVCSDEVAKDGAILVARQKMVTIVDARIVTIVLEFGLEMNVLEVVEVQYDRDRCVKNGWLGSQYRMGEVNRSR